MSLLVPTEIDYIDAHGDSSLDPLYLSELDEQTKTNPHVYKWQFETVPGFFVQADDSTDDLAFRYTESSLGRTKSWGSIMAELEKLNREADENVSYKLVHCARHGQGFHNLIVEKYGIAEWNEKWNVLGSDGEVTYGPDAMLTELGINQAKENNGVWKEEIKSQGAPIPSQFYVSPLQRSLWTCLRTWEGLRPANQKVMIREILRETIGQNLCDKRLTKLVIEERFSSHNFEVEEGFPEEDELFTPKRETGLEQTMRVNRFCQELFEQEWDEQKRAVNKDNAVNNTFVSTTTHAGTIRSFITVFKHRKFTISTGGMVLIVVKATRRKD